MPPDFREEDAMRTILVMVSVLELLIAGMALRAEPKGERATIKGEAVDLWCYFEGGDRGPAKKACATACAKAGNPIGIVDGGGNVYVTAGLKDHEAGRVLLLDKMSQEVTVTGTVVRNGGVQMIYVESVK
jgi:hypothetical protein